MMEKLGDTLEKRDLIITIPILSIYIIKILTTFVRVLIFGKYHFVIDISRDLADISDGPNATLD